MEDYDNLFYDVIKERGLEYYYKGNVVSCINADGRYYAKVHGNYNNTYNVLIDFNNDNIYMECSCPFDGACKHEYATLLAIDNKEYINKDIKKVSKENVKPLQQLIKEIPAEELKNYLLKEDGINHIYFDINDFEQHFIKYMPDQDYEHYYNKLYNAYVLEGFNFKLLDSYLNKINTLVIIGNYYEAYKIIKSIIESSNDLKLLKKYNYLIEKMPIISMNLKIIYKKINKKNKKEITSWINNLKQSKYYNNIFIEELIYNLK